MNVLDDIRKARRDLLRTCITPSEVKCHPAFYDALRAACDATTCVPSQEAYPHTVFGMRIVIDLTMKPGEWKLR